MRGSPEINERIASIYIEWKSERKVKKDTKGNPVMNEKGTNVLYEYDGYFKYYDREKKEDVKLPMPFRFIPLEVLSTIKGFNNEFKCGIVSNEVKYIAKEPLEVKTWKGGLSVKGLYKDIKGEIDAIGGKYGNSVYVGFFIDDKLEIANIQIHGAALSPFIEYGKTHKKLTEEGAMQVKSFKEDTVGDNTFASPIFEELVVSAETLVDADKLGIKLKEYLDGYFKRGNAKEEDAITEQVAKEVQQKVEEERKGYMKPNDIANGGDSHIDPIDDLPFLFNPNFFKIDRFS